MARLLTKPYLQTMAVLNSIQLLARNSVTVVFDFPAVRRILSNMTRKRKEKEVEKGKWTEKRKREEDVAEGSRFRGREREKVEIARKKKQ